MAVGRVTKITASSSNNFQEAVDLGLERASRTLRGITGLEVVNQKATVVDGAIAEYHATSARFARAWRPMAAMRFPAPALTPWRSRWPRCSTA